MYYMSGNGNKGMFTTSTVYAGDPHCLDKAPIVRDVTVHKISDLFSFQYNFDRSVD